jgi:hypothetical protein
MRFCYFIFELKFNTFIEFSGSPGCHLILALAFHKLDLNMKIDEFILKIKSDLKIWFEKLNLVIGAVALGFTGLAYKSSHPELLGWIFIFVIFAFLHSIRHYYPEELKKLQEKKTKKEAELVLLKGVESHFLSLRKSLREAPLFWIGIGSLFAVSSGLKTLVETKILPIIGG